jgi:hypothetical protein
MSLEQTEVKHVIRLAELVSCVQASVLFGNYSVMNHIQSFRQCLVCELSRDEGAEIEKLTAEPWHS